jgi:anti-sigma factor RsiW
MSCAVFEEFLTDYLDGFLPAHLYHRWERHAALCDRCTELPGDVVRAIGACYTYINEEQPVPVGLNERILQATLGTVVPEEVRAPWTARAASWLRLWLDPIVSPQLATVATMLLVAILVLTNTVSADGSIGGVYKATVQLAEQTSGKAKTEVEEITNPSRQSGQSGEDKPSTDQQQDQNKPAGNVGSGSNNR